MSTLRLYKLSNFCNSSVFGFLLWAADFPSMCTKKLQESILFFLVNYFFYILSFHIMPQFPVYDRIKQNRKIIILWIKFRRRYMELYPLMIYPYFLVWKLYSQDTFLIDRFADNPYLFVRINDNAVPYLVFTA